MRILQLCNKPPYPTRDGGSLAMFNLAGALQYLGHSITVLTMFTDKHRITSEQHRKYSGMMEVHTVYVHSAITLSGLTGNLLFSGKPYTASRFYSFRFEKELIRLLKSNRYDIIQLEGLYLTQYIKAIRRHSDALVSLRAHNIEHEIWNRTAREERDFFRRKYFSLVAKRLKRFETDALNSYDLLVPITERDNEQFRVMGNTKPSHVTPAGVDLKESTLTSTRKSGEPFTLFFLGSLDWIPNKEGLLWFVYNVFPLLRKKYHDLKLHVAGRNAPRSFVKKLELPGIVYHGEIDDPDEFTKAHTVMIAPCFSGSGMRLKIIGAMSHGKPVVTTTVGAEGLDVKNDENIMIADDPVSFFEYIERLINYPDLCEQMGKAAHHLVYKKYNNLEIAVSLAEFYNQQLQ